MATKASPVVSAGNRGKGLPLVPPEEQFWQRYSPHHEAPLSWVSSVALHLFVISVLAMSGWLLLMLGYRPDNSVKVESVRIAGGGGPKIGKAEAGGDGPLVDAAGDDGPKDQVPDDEVPPPPDLKSIDRIKQTLPPEMQNDKDVARYVASGNPLLQKLSGLNKEAQKRLMANVPQQGKGGNGSGGGEGSGKGTGTGDGQGAGTQSGKLSESQKRNLRWTMRFDTRSGNDYLAQLRGLGAYIAVPKDAEGKDYYLIRDLSQKPAKLLDEDVRELQRIFWIDDKPQSVAAIAQALGLREVPSHFVAFMPKELEEKLFKLELKFKGLREDDIFETKFDVVRQGGRYEPRVTSQTKK